MQKTQHLQDHSHTENTGGRHSDVSRPLVMVCLSPSPSCRRVIRAAARMVSAPVPDTGSVPVRVPDRPGTADHVSEPDRPGTADHVPEPDRSGRAGGQETIETIETIDAPAPIALYVGSSGREADEDSRLRENIRYARECGFEVHTIRGSDIPLTISEYARREGVTDLFIGYSPPSFFLQTKPAINEKLLSYLPTVDIHIIPDPVSSSYAGAIRRDAPGTPIWNPRDLVLVLGVMAVATLLASWFYVSRYSNSNIITIYILGVLIASVMTSSRIYGTFAAVLYVLLFNFLFIEPRFTLLVYDSAYLMTYLVTVVAALITGTVAVRLKNIARVSAENAYQAKVLLDTSNRLESAADSDAVINTTCMQLVHLLNRAVIFFPYTDSKKKAPVTGKTAETTGTPGRIADTESVEPSGLPDAPSAAPAYLLFPAGEKTISPQIPEREQEAVRWSMRNSHQSGAFTSHFEDCSCRYLSVFSGENQYGVIGIDMEDRPFTEFENTILLSIVHEGTMALENKRIIQDQKKAEINAENERLRTVLLRSISHDLRTPLTSIYGNAANLRSYETDLPREERDKLYEDIMEDAGWLNAQFENILAMTRLESDPGIRRTIENMEDVIEESLRHLPAHPDHEIVFLQETPEISPGPDSPDRTGAAAGGRTRTDFEEPADPAPPSDTCGLTDTGVCLPLVEMDPRLIMQVLINLLGNALKYTPDGTRIEVRLDCNPDTVTVDVADRGPGIPDEDKPHVFELFYTGHHTLSDSSRSMGLGLNLCAQILRAHGGSIEVLDNEPTGAVFRFRLPAARIPADAVHESSTG